MSYLQYWLVSNLYGWTVSQKLPVNNFEWIKYAYIFCYLNILWKNYNEKSDKGYFLEAGAQYLEKLHERYSDLQFCPEKKKIKKVEKLVANLHDKSEYVVHMVNLKQALNHGLVFKKNHRMSKLNQNAWLKPYIDIEHRSNKKSKK